MSTITLNSINMNEVTAAWKEQADNFGNQFFTMAKFLTVESHLHRSYKISGGAFPDNPPTIWTVSIEIHGETFKLSKGEYYDDGSRGWETSPWGVNGRYEYGNGAKYITDSLYDAILASARIPDDIKHFRKEEYDTLWKDHHNDAFQQIADATELELWVSRIVKTQSTVAVSDTGTITLNCYIDQLVENTDGKFDAFEHAWFTVPRSWASDLVKTYQSGFTHLEHFERDYTYDNTDGWLKRAIDEGVLIGCGTGNMKPARTHSVNISGTQVDIEVSVNRDGDLVLKGLPFPVNFEMFDDTLVLMKHKSNS